MAGKGPWKWFCMKLKVLRWGRLLREWTSMRPLRAMFSSLMPHTLPSRLQRRPIQLAARPEHGAVDAFQVANNNGKEEALSICKESLNLRRKSESEGAQEAVKKKWNIRKYLHLKINLYSSSINKVIASVDIV